MLARTVTQEGTDPDINMPKAEYLEQRNKIQADLKNAAGKLQEIEAQPLKNMKAWNAYRCE
jgi:hypothetical protein